jgi:hypothetical protein
MCSSVTAQRWFVSQGQPSEGVIGLLDLSDETQNYADDALLFKRSPVSSDEELPTEESDYEIAAAVVYER